MMIFIPMKYTSTFCRNLVRWGIFISLNISKETTYFIFTPKIRLPWYFTHLSMHSKPTKKQCYRNMFVRQISPLIPQIDTRVGVLRYPPTQEDLIMDEWVNTPQSDACCTDAENIINSLRLAKTLDDLNFMFKFAMVFKQSDPETVFNIYNEYCRAFKSIFKQIE